MFCYTVKDKANHAVVLDKTTSEKLYKDVQSYRLITVATLVDRLKINGSLARQALADLEEKGLIKKVVGHSKLNIYSTFPLLLSSLALENVLHPYRSVESCEDVKLLDIVLTCSFFAARAVSAAAE